MRWTGFLVLMFIAAAPARAQIAETSDLYAQMLAADRTLFERGFNQCDLAALDEDQRSPKKLSTAITTTTRPTR